MVDIRTKTACIVVDEHTAIEDVGQRCRYHTVQE